MDTQPTPRPDPDDKAAAVLGALAGGRQIAPFTDAEPDFGLGAAKAVSAAVARRRRERGETPVGWKVGFTNRTIWDEYGVHAPIYGPVWDTTLRPVKGEAEFPLEGLVEPRIEPEIVFRFAREPRPGMDELALAACLDGVAHGFEIVQSLFPGWRFRAADTVAAFALHGALLVGPWTAMPGWRMPVEWRRLLEGFAVTLFRDGVPVDRGAAENVLGGPLSALRHFLGELAADGEALPGPGAIVTTGTVTRAFPVAAGERWTTRVDGLVVCDMDVRFL